MAQQRIWRPRARNSGVRAPSLSARERKTFAAPERETVIRTSATQHFGGGKSARVARGVARKVDVAGVCHFNARLFAQRDGDLIARTDDSAAEHLEGRTHLAGATRSARRDATRAPAHAVTMRRTSPSTPAAVTTAPAPG